MASINCWPARILPPSARSRGVRPSKPLKLYGIRQLLVDAEALAERGIEVGELMVPVELRSGSELAQHLDSCDQVLVF
jgi:sulfur relay (sulfurtransferase) DsrF/TusC family protein